MYVTAVYWRSTSWRRPSSLCVRWWILQMIKWSAVRCSAASPFSSCRSTSSLLRWVILRWVLFPHELSMVCWVVPDFTISHMAEAGSDSQSWNKKEFPKSWVWYLYEQRGNLSRPWKFCGDGNEIGWRWKQSLWRRAGMGAISVPMQASSIGFLFDSVK